MFYNMSLLEKVLFLKRNGGSSSVHEETSYTGSFVTDVVAPLKKLLLTLSPKQSGSGTPSPDNVRPIEGWTDVDTHVAGKNLFDINSATFKKWGLYSNVFQVLSDDSTFVRINGVSDGAVTYVTNATYCGIGFIVDAMPLERVVSVPQRIGGAVQFWSAYEDGATRLSTGATSCTIPANTSGFVALRTDARSTTTTKIQIELGSTATAYEPYQGTPYTTDLGRTVYGADVEQVGGVLTDKMGMVDLGTLNWIKYSNYPNLFYANDARIKQTGGSTILGNAVCSQYAICTEAQIGVSGYTNGFFAIGGTSARVWVNDPRYTDATAFKTAMDGVQLCYELATPQTYQLTPQQINSLIGQNNLTSDGNITEVVYLVKDA